MNDDFEGLISMPDMEIRGQLVQLRQQHKDLDAAVAALEGQPVINQLQVLRLKKQKLILKDQISRLEARLKPDIIA
jgi:hypothetical protein